jgi:hypothetical protein
VKGKYPSSGPSSSRALPAHPPPRTPGSSCQPAERADAPVGVGAGANPIARYRPTSAPYHNLSSDRLFGGVVTWSTGEGEAARWSRRRFREP